MGFVVAIDGPAGSGKGTITKIIAERCNLVSIDTGAMYRCVALECLNKNVTHEEVEKIEKILEYIKIELKKNEGNQEVWLNGVNVSEEIRTTKVDEVVAKFAALKCVRDKVTPMQREMGKTNDIIMEGRDIGTVVFPNADVKIFLECSVEERANRRYKQNLEKGIECTYEEILESIKERNKLETEREIAPFIKADDAILVDSTKMSINEVVEKIINIIEDVKKNDKRIKIELEEKKALHENNLKNKITDKTIQKEKSKKNNQTLDKKIVKAIIKSAMFLYYKIVYRIKVIGIENVPKQGGIILCANHRTYMDPQLVEITCKRKDTRFLAKEELTKNWIFAYLGKVFNVILVKRDNKDIGPMKETLKTLKEGKAIALFPEGTRNGIEKGEKVKDGAAYFALNSNALVIPIGIKGGEKPFKKITITYGKPLNLEEYKQNKKENVSMVTDLIMEHICALCRCNDSETRKE